MAVGAGRASASAATGSFTSASSSQNTSSRSGLRAAIARPNVDRLARSPGIDRMPHCSAASTALARMRCEVDAADLGVARQHRLQPRHAHLDRLLHHVVEPLVLERGEQVVQVERRGLRARLLLADQRAWCACRGASVARHSPSRPLKTSTASPALSRSTLREIMRLRLAERDLGAGLRARPRHEAGGCGNRIGASRPIHVRGI